MHVDLMCMLHRTYNSFVDLLKSNGLSCTLLSSTQVFTVHKHPHAIHSQSVTQSEP